MILRSLSSGYEINNEAFHQYCTETAELYIELYGWYYMPTTLHKLLIQGAAIAKESLLPIGVLSEEALESRSKDGRKFREHHSKKSSRILNNENIFRILLLTSDPYISIISGVPKRYVYQLK